MPVLNGYMSDFSRKVNQKIDNFRSRAPPKSVPGFGCDEGNYFGKSPGLPQHAGSSQLRSGTNLRLKSLKVIQNSSIFTVKRLMVAAPAAFSCERGKISYLKVMDNTVPGRP